MHICLETFYAATMMVQGHAAVLTDWFTTMHHLFTEIYNWKLEAEEILNDMYLTTSLTSAWNKVEKYYKLADETPVYYAAVVLDPRLKMHYFRSIWTTAEETTWINSVEGLFVRSGGIIT